jgi:hypothetical protein
MDMKAALSAALKVAAKGGGRVELLAVSWAALLAAKMAACWVVMKVVMLV